ncbi:chorismate mutase [Candidatus Peregrinibacteria bacterium]|nr:chorismate mutase [Candidatus Peregrinibacteria bacterium]
MNIPTLRLTIDDVDFQIICLLSERIKIVQKICDLKAKNNIPVYQPKRESLMLKKRKTFAKKYGLRDQFILDLFVRIFEESRYVQEECQSPLKK